jgi:hypothetical protein
MAAFAAARLHWFAGRTLELRELSAFVEYTPAPSASPVCVVRAGAGAGKSALMANLGE